MSNVTVGEALSVFVLLVSSAVMATCVREIYLWFRERKRGYPMQCAWCKAEIGRSVIPDSHGICVPCAERLKGHDVTWTVQELARSLDVPNSQAWRRVQQWLTEGKIVKVSGETSGDVARFRWTEKLKPPASKQVMP